MLHLHLQNENEQRPVQQSPFRNRSRCMRKRGVYDAVGVAVFAGDSPAAGCCLTVLLDAAAPGGASSNRRLGVDTAPGAPPQPPLPRVIRHPIGRSRTGLRPPWVKRERESWEVGGAQDQGWFSPRASAAQQTAMPRIVEQNIHHTFLFSLAPHYLQPPC